MDPRPLTLSLETSASFSERHIGPNSAEISTMLKAVGASSLEDLVKKAVPDSIQIKKKLNLPEALPKPMPLKNLKQSLRKIKFINLTSDWVIRIAPSRES